MVIGSTRITEEIFLAVSGVFKRWIENTDPYLRNATG
jgi:hypothetical protein